LAFDSMAICHAGPSPGDANMRSCPSPERHRRCGRCGQLKPLSAFAWRRRARLQRDNYCRPCRADYKREHYLANRERYIAAATRRKAALIAERMMFLIEFFRRSPCVDCGETDPLVLEFDHLGPSSSTSPPDARTGPGRTSCVRSTSATSFVQTVTVAEPPAVAVSRARR